MCHMSRSDRHKELQNMLVRWMRNRSFKMCGLPECNIVGYIADFVAIAGMHYAEHNRYAFHSKLTTRYMSYRKVDGELIRKMVGDIDRWYVCVFEVKVSRNDFLNTFGKNNTPHSKARMEPVGTAHWVVTEKGICKPEELPDFWGLLTPYGTGLTELKRPKLHILPDERLHSFAFDMLWLQMNCRSSYYDQLNEMAQTIKLVHEAIVKSKPIGEIHRRCDRAVKACQGFI